MSKHTPSALPADAAIIAAAFELRQNRRGWSGNCPSCGYAGTFSMSVKDGRALWWCASCRDRDGLLAAVRNATGGAWTPPASPGTNAPTDDAGRTRAALAIWAEAISIKGTLAEVYLAARGLTGEGSTALRYCPALRHPKAPGTFPALVALVRSTTTGEPVAIHRTYLRRDGSGKADVEPSKATKGPMGGGAIMLHEPVAGAPLIISEGIESALSAGRIIGGPAWSAVAAGNLKNIVPPKGPSAIVLAADPDPVGQREALAAAERWQAIGRPVRLATPNDADADFNDLLLRSLDNEVRHDR
jgi:putative DNA primase/helicase